MIEPLEPRIAPAAVVSTIGKTATWTDFDGDKVTLKWSTGDIPSFASDPVGVTDGVIVKRITFDSSHTGAGITLTVKAAGGGDGRIDLGRVDATGIALGSWSAARATIAEFDAGDGITSLKSFVSGGLGGQAVGLFTGAGGDGVSKIDGQLGTFTVQGNVAATKLQIDAPFETKITKIEIKGSLLGTAPTSPASGSAGVLEINNVDQVGSIIIGGSIVGGKNAATGVLQYFGNLGSLSVKGNIVGGEADGTGSVTLATTKTLSIGGNLQGGSADGTGVVSGGSVEKLTVGGSLIGGTVAGTATLTFASAASVLIKGSIVGTTGITGGANEASAALVINGPAGSVTLGGDLLGGSNAAGVGVAYNGALLFDADVKTLTIKGNIRGTDGLGAFILVKGSTPATAGNFSALGKLTIGGSVTLATIATGHGADTTSLAARIGAAENPDAGIGSLSVGGDWEHSNLLAGIDDLGSSGVDLTDTRTAGGAAVAAIGAIVIKGDLLDSGAYAGTSGFAAEKIASLTAGGQKLFTTGSPGKTLNWNGRVFIREI